jgi:peptidoglycan/LPS O-acetylase OafA/YrhL
LDGGIAFWLIFAAGVSHAFLIHFVFLFTLGAQYSIYPMHAVATRLAPYSLAAYLVISIAANAPALISTMIAHQIGHFVYIGIGLIGLPYVAASLAQQSNSFDRRLGELSFPLYVLHSPALKIAASWSSSIDIGLAVAISAALTLAAHASIDRPMETLRSRFVRRRLVAPDQQGRGGLLPSDRISAPAPNLEP